MNSNIEKLITEMDENEVMKHCFNAITSAQNLKKAIKLFKTDSEHLVSDSTYAKISSISPNYRNILL